EVAARTGRHEADRNAVRRLGARAGMYVAAGLELELVRLHQRAAVRVLAHEPLGELEDLDAGEPGRLLVVAGGWLAKRIFERELALELAQMVGNRIAQARLGEHRHATLAVVVPEVQPADHD